VDSRGNEVTFDPTSGTASAAGVQKVHTGSSYSTALDCPRADQCTAVGGAGKAATFTPPAGAVKAALIDRGGSLVGVSCPSADRCTTIDAGHEFALGLGGKRARVGRPREIVGDFGLQAVSCATSTQCTAVDWKNHSELTFDPVTRAINRAGLRPIDPAGTLTAVACPTAAKCVAVDLQGYEVTFDPENGKVVTGARKLRRMDNVFRVSCPAADQCTAVDSQEELTFDPRPSGLEFLGRASFFARYGVSGMNGLSCPSRTECVAIAGRDELAFRPLSGHVIGGGKKGIGPTSGAEQLNAVSCSSVHRCVAVGNGGVEVSFDPASPRRRAVATISQAAALTSVSCVPTGRCVAVDAAGNAFVATR
jgi:hypothetical protein